MRISKIVVPFFFRFFFPTFTACSRGSEKRKATLKPSYTYHEKNDFVAWTKRFVDIASANQNCCGDNFTCTCDKCNCCGSNSYWCCNNWHCQHNNSGLLRLYQQNVLLRQQRHFLREQRGQLHGLRKMCSRPTYRKLHRLRPWPEVFYAPLHGLHDFRSSAVQYDISFF